jgi:VWFA-related protein
MSVLLAASAFAQETNQPETTTLRLGSNLVLVPTQVQTKKGEMIYDLKPEQFIVEDNGIAQKIHLDEDTDALGLSLVVVVQCSRGAYAQFNRMQGLEAMVDDVTGGAPHQVALVSYGNEPDLLAPFTSDPTKLGEGFSPLAPCDDGGVATLDAVNYAIHLFDDPKSGIAPGRNRRAILLISEAHDYGSRMKPAQVVANLGRTNTVVDSVSFDPGKEAIVNSLIHGQAGPGLVGLLVMAVEALKKNVPQTLSALSGGEYTVFSSQNKFDAGIHKLANHIHNFYLISFQPPDPAPGLHRISVKIPDYPDAKIRTRLTYYQGDAPPPELPEKDKKDRKKE